MSARTVLTVSATETEDVQVLDRFYFDQVSPYCLHVNTDGGAEVYMAPDAAEAAVEGLVAQMLGRNPDRAGELIDRLVELATVVPEPDDGSDAIYDRIQDARSGL